MLPKNALKIYKRVCVMLNIVAPQSGSEKYIGILHFNKGKEKVWKIWCRVRKNSIFVKYTSVSQTVLVKENFRNAYLNNNISPAAIYYYTILYYIQCDQY